MWPICQDLYMEILCWQKYVTRDFNLWILLCTQITRHLLSSILQKVGYSYVRPAPNHIYLAKETHPMQEYRLKYLKAIKAARRHRTIVYIDESYVNQNHHAAKTWLKRDSKVGLFIYTFKQIYSYKCVWVLYHTQVYLSLSLLYNEVHCYSHKRGWIWLLKNISLNDCMSV